MAEIYEHAYLTICTPASSTCHQGFLTRQLSKSVEIRFESKVDKTAKGWLNIRRSRVSPLAHGVFDLYTDDVEDSRWYERGWTYQELRLSRRILLFGRSRVHFICPSMQKSEDSKVHSRPYHMLAVGELLRGPRDHDSVYQNALQYLYWQDLVSIYMNNCKLMYETDRLPALSGLAKAMNDGPGNYLAGLWKENLAQDLCWFTVAEDHERLKSIRGGHWWLAGTSCEDNTFATNDCLHAPEKISVHLYSQYKQGRIGNHQP